MLNINLVYLGRRGAGPKLTLDFYNEFAKDKEVNSKLIISDSNTILDQYLDIQNLLVLKVGRGILEIAKNFLSLLTFFLRLVKSNKYNSDYNLYLFTMVHPFNFLLMLIIKIFDKKSHIVVIIHDANQHLGEKSATIGAIMTTVESKLSDTIATLSESVASILRDRFKDKKIITFHHGVFDYGFVTEPRSLNKSKDIVLLAIGRIVEYKGYDLLIKSFEILKSKYNNIKLIIAGEGPIYNFIKKEDTERLGVVIENKYLSDDDISKYLDLSDILVLPYIEASQSGVLALSSCKALPVVATPVGGLREQCLTLGNSLLSYDLSQESFSNSVANLIDDEALYQRLSKNAIDSQSRVSWKEGVDKIKSLVALN